MTRMNSSYAEPYERANQPMQPDAKSDKRIASKNLRSEPGFRARIRWVEIGQAAHPGSARHQKRTQRPGTAPVLDQCGFIWDFPEAGEIDRHQ